MKQPLLNINFCGTGMEATRQGLASVQAINQFSDRLILSGVGAPDGYDEKNNEHYPTPGMFTVDEKLKRQPRSFMFKEPISVIQRGAGFAWGAGERDNLALAMKHVAQKMQHLPAGEKVHINLSGYSRGGASAVHLANRLHKKYGTRVHVNLFLIDPNAGLGRQHYQHKRNIPPNVDNLYVVFNRHETIGIFKSLNLPHYLLSNPKTAVTALYLKGGHLDQEQLPTVENKDAPSVSERNQALLESFYESYGALREEPSKARHVYKKDDNVKKGFVSYKQHQTALDREISQFDLIGQHQRTPLHFEENEFLAQFNQEIGALNNRYYSELSYYFTHLLNEIDRGNAKTHKQQEAAALLLQTTNKLIQAMTPSKMRTQAEKKAALHDFKQCLHLGGYSDTIRQIAAHLIGFISGVFLGVTFGVGGFFTGLTQWRTAGLASIPYAAIGAYNGFNAGFEWGKREVLGHQNARHIQKTVEKIVNDEQNAGMMPYGKRS